MGTIKKGILGGFSGTVGTVVGANWRGIDIIRSRPKVSNSQPSTLQILQRKKFSTAIKFQNALRAMQSRLYGDAAGVKSRVNLAASYLLKEVVTDEAGQVKLLMDKVLITKGDLTGFQSLEKTMESNQKIRFTWEDNSEQALAHATDLFCTAVYEEEAGAFFLQEGPSTRAEATATITLPAAWSGKKVHIFAFFQNELQDKACTSVYLQSETVA